MVNWGLAIQNWIGAQILTLFGSSEVSVAIILMIITSFLFLTGFSAEVKLVGLLILIAALLAPGYLGGAAILTDVTYFYFIVIIAALLIATAIIKFKETR